MKKLITEGYRVQQIIWQEVIEIDREERNKCFDSLRYKEAFVQF